MHISQRISNIITLSHDPLTRWTTFQSIVEETGEMEGIQRSLLFELSALSQIREEYIRSCNYHAVTQQQGYLHA